MSTDHFWRLAMAVILCMTLMRNDRGVAHAEAEISEQESFVRLDRLIPDLVQDMRYAGNNNFVGRTIEGYEAPVALMTREAAAALALVADDLRQQGLRLCVYDAYRPETAVADFVRWAQNPEDDCMRASFYPDLSKRELFEKGYIAERSGHSRGSTVDLTLIDASGAPLDMGSTFDLFSPISAHGAKGLTGEQRANRKLLRDAMEQRGFKAYRAEWWHYTLKNEPFPDRAFAFPVQDRVYSAANSQYIVNLFNNTMDRINIPAKK